MTEQRNVVMWGGKSFYATPTCDNTCNRLSWFKFVQIKFGLFNFYIKCHAFIKCAVAILGTFIFWALIVEKKKIEAAMETGFGGSKINALFFFHNPEFIVSQ